MEARVFGRTRLRVSPIGLGGYPFGGLNRAAGWAPLTPEGQRTAVATIHRAVDRGITYLDTAPGYGGGTSETIFGAALAQGGYRQRVTLATKCPWKSSARDVLDSAEASLRRLGTDVLDVLQFHGGMFSPEDVHHILEEGPLDALRRLREAGKVRFLGFTCEEPWTARTLIASGAFDAVRLRGSATTSSTRARPCTPWTRRTSTAWAWP
jgi:aryl-alcohol dehydrogenase-like predicted oxidoreductase